MVSAGTVYGVAGGAGSDCTIRGGARVYSICKVKVLGSTEISSCLYQHRRQVVAASRIVCLEEFDKTKRRSGKTCRALCIKGIAGTGCTSAKYNLSPHTQASRGCSLFIIAFSPRPWRGKGWPSFGHGSFLNTIFQYLVHSIWRIAYSPSYMFILYLYNSARADGCQHKLHPQTITIRVFSVG